MILPTSYRIRIWITLEKYPPLAKEIEARDTEVGEEDTAVEAEGMETSWNTTPTRGVRTIPPALKINTRITNGHFWPRRINKRSLNWIREKTATRRIFLRMKLLQWRPTIKVHPQMLQRGAMRAIMKCGEWYQQRIIPIWINAEFSAPPCRRIVMGCESRI